MSFNVLEYFNKRIPKEVLEYAAERDCLPDVIVKFKPTAESEPYYALCMVGEDIDWVEVVRKRAHEIVVAYAYPIKTASQRIAVSTRYLAAMELPFVPIIPAELPLIHNFRFHHKPLNQWIMLSDSSKDQSFENLFVDYMMRQDEFELSGYAFSHGEGSYNFKIFIEKHPENNTYRAEMVGEASELGLNQLVSSEELGHLDQAFFKKLYQFCLNYGKARLEDDIRSVKDIEDLIRQKRLFHDILNYFNK